MVLARRRRLPHHVGAIESSGPAGLGLLLALTTMLAGCGHDGDGAAAADPLAAMPDQFAGVQQELSTSPERIEAYYDEPLEGTPSVVEDVLDPGTINPGEDVEIHLVGTDTGVLSVVLVAEPCGMMEAFRSEALALADTIDIVATGGITDEAC